MNEGTYPQNMILNGPGDLGVLGAGHASGTPPQDLGMSEEGLPNIPEGGFALLNSVAVDGAGTFGVSTTAFDNMEELLWTGNSGGHVTSYFGPNLDKYTSFQVVPRNSDHPEVRSILTHERGILALSQNRLKCNKRQGLGVFNYTSGNLVDSQCMDFSPGTLSHLVIGGFQQTLIQLDIEKLVETRVVKIAQNDCTILRGNDKFLYSGDTQGNVTLRDPKTFDAMHVLECHKGSLSDFHVCGMKLVTSGFSYRLGQLQCDRFLMLYDLRTLRAQRPVPLNFEPAFIRFLPTYSDNRLVVASQSGEFQVFEIGELTSYPFQVETQGSGLFCLDVCPSKQCVAMGDGAGGLHLFSDRAQPLFNDHSRQTEFADPIPSLAPMSFDDLTIPYSMIPLPMPESGNYLSEWPPHLCRRVYRRPIPVDPEILKSMRVSQFVGYAPNPGNRRRNQVPYEDPNTGPHTSNPLMFSDSFSTQSNGENALADSFNKGEETGFQVPKLYRKMTVKPGKFFGDEAGAMKFWRNYNQTGLSGLESTTPNTYCNAIMLILYHIEPLRNQVMSHLCCNEFCLTCELSFLFKMMAQSAGKIPCSGNNYIRTFRTIPEATALGLVLNDKVDMSTLNGKLSEKIQSFNRFMLQQMHMDSEQQMSGRPGARVPDPGSPGFISIEEEPSLESDDSAFSKKSPEAKKWSTVVQRLFASETAVNQTCKCGKSIKRTDRPMVLSISYPSEEKITEKVKFESLVEQSLCCNTDVQSWCEKCGKYQNVKQEKRVVQLPEILAINISATTDKDRDFLFAQQRLWPAEKQDGDPGVENRRMNLTKPCRYGLACNRPNCRFLHQNDNTTGSDSELNDSGESATPPSSWFPSSMMLSVSEKGRKSSENTQEECEKDTYELRGMVFLIKESDQEHLISAVKPRSIPGLSRVSSAKTLGGTESPLPFPIAGVRKGGGWIVFNDFVVSETAEYEAIQFSMDWKIPCVMYYAKTDMESRHETKVTDPIGETVFWMDDCVSVRRRLSSSKFVPLEETEIPKRGDIVAMDAEFVTLNQEEAEFKSDGTKSMIKPSQMSLARVSCIRGSGDLEGVPFLDDYISTQEEVVDYLTKFSGIKPGDLDPCMTSKHLTTLKSSYLKLRYLVDNGVIFVGHGLSNDFRVINILVPPEQVRDTVHLFHLPHHRMMSLRFLAWYFLDMKIQSETHDSIEDARTALKLYKKYQSLTLKGPAEFGKVMSELYETARKMDWKVPGDS